MRSPFLSLTFAAGVGLLLTAGPARAQTYGKAPMPGKVGPDAPKNIGFDPKFGSAVPPELELYDHDNAPVKLRDAIGGKPTVLVLHYNRCPKLCNEVIQALLRALNAMMRSDPAFVAGGPFNVIFVSIDPKDAPATVRKARSLFHREYDKRADDQTGVWFLTASHGQGTDVTEADRKIHELAAAVGFRYAMRYQNREYYYRPETAIWATEDGRREVPTEARSYDYEHTPGVVVLTPEGTVSRYLLGIDIDAPAADVNIRGRDLRMALIDASGGTIGTTFERYVGPLCFAYDDVSGHYAVTMRYVAILFAPVYLFVAYLAYRTIRQVMREPALKPGESGLPTTA